MTTSLFYANKDPRGTPPAGFDDQGFKSKPYTGPNMPSPFLSSCW